MYAYVSCDYCLLSRREGLLRRAVHSYGVVLPSVACLSVIVKPRYEEAVAYSRLSSQGKKCCLTNEDKVMYVIKRKFVSPL